MRLFVSALLCLFLAGCASVDFQPYEGKTSIYEGHGGTKVTVNGVDFWANGSPPQKYRLIGIVVSEIGSGVGDESMIRSAVAKEVKARGGDAAIEVGNSESMTGVVQTSPSLYMTAGIRRMKFGVVKYIP